MGGFVCTCGESVDDNTDFLPYKAHLIADQDFEDFQAASAASPMEAHEFVKATVYQCPSCARLIVVPNSGEDEQTFTPDGDASPLLLGSVRGEDWKRILTGFWTDSEGSGYVFWGDTGTQEGDNGFVSLSSWQEVESLYYEVFRRLLGADRLRSALLRRNPATPKMETVHLWPVVETGGD